MEQQQSLWSSLMDKQQLLWWGYAERHNLCGFFRRKDKKLPFYIARSLEIIGGGIRRELGSEERKEDREAMRPETPESSHVASIPEMGRCLRVRQNLKFILVLMMSWGFILWVFFPCEKSVKFKYQCSKLKVCVMTEPRPLVFPAEPFML